MEESPQAERLSRQTAFQQHLCSVGLISPVRGSGAVSAIARSHSASASDGRPPLAALTREHDIAGRPAPAGPAHRATEVRPTVHRRVQPAIVDDRPTTRGTQPTGALDNGPPPGIGDHLGDSRADQGRRRGGLAARLTHRRDVQALLKCPKTPGPRRRRGGLRVPGWATGLQGWWVHLRRCASSAGAPPAAATPPPSQHATNHFKTTGILWPRPRAGRSGNYEFAVLHPESTPGPAPVATRRTNRKPAPADNVLANHATRSTAEPLRQRWAGPGRRRPAGRRAEHGSHDPPSRPTSSRCRDRRRGAGRPTREVSHRGRSRRGRAAPTRGVHGGTAGARAWQGHGMYGFSSERDRNRSLLVRSKAVGK